MMLSSELASCFG